MDANNFAKIARMFTDNIFETLMLTYQAVSWVFGGVGALLDLPTAWWSLLFVLWIGLVALTAHNYYLRKGLREVSGWLEEVEAVAAAQLQALKDRVKQLEKGLEQEAVLDPAQPFEKRDDPASQMEVWVNGAFRGHAIRLPTRVVSPTHVLRTLGRHAGDVELRKNGETYHTLCEQWEDHGSDISSLRWSPRMVKLGARVAKISQLKVDLAQLPAVVTSRGRSSAALLKPNPARRGYFNFYGNTVPGFSGAGIFVDNSLISVHLGNQSGSYQVGLSAFLLQALFEEDVEEETPHDDDDAWKELEFADDSVFGPLNLKLKNSGGKVSRRAVDDAIRAREYDDYVEDDIQPSQARRSAMSRAISDKLGYEPEKQGPYKPETVCDLMDLVNEAVTAKLANFTQAPTAVAKIPITTQKTVKDQAVSTDSCVNANHTVKCDSWAAKVPKAVYKAVTKTHPCDGGPPKVIELESTNTYVCRCGATVRTSRRETHDQKCLWNKVLQQLKTEVEPEAASPGHSYEHSPPESGDSKGFRKTHLPGKNK